LENYPHLIIKKPLTHRGERLILHGATLIDCQLLEAIISIKYGFIILKRYSGLH